MILSLPASKHLLMICFISWGAKNWAFLILIMAPVFAMASSAGNFSVVTGADASALQNVCKELSVFAEVTVEKEVEVICVQETAERKGEMSEKGLVTLLKDIPLLMVSSEEGSGSVSLTVRRKDRDKVLNLFFAC